MGPTHLSFHPCVENLRNYGVLPQTVMSKYNQGTPSIGLPSLTELLSPRLYFPPSYRMFPPFKILT